MKQLLEWLAPYNLVLFLAGNFQEEHCVWGWRSERNPIGVSISYITSKPLKGRVNLLVSSGNADSLCNADTDSCALAEGKRSGQIEHLEC